MSTFCTAVTIKTCEIGYRDSWRSLEIRGQFKACLWCIQGCAKEWTLGCMNPASWLPLAAGCKFTQPRDHSFAQPCRIVLSFKDGPRKQLRRRLLRSSYLSCVAPARAPLAREWIGYSAAAWPGERRCALNFSVTASNAYRVPEKACLRLLKRVINSASSRLALGRLGNS